MAIKNKPCKHCGSDLHLSLSCFKKPIKAPVKRVAVKKAKTPTKAKKKPETRSQLVKKLDKVFSEYIRMTKPAVCVTCGKQDEWRNLQNGHYYSRAKYPTRWNEDNCHPQCVGCNVFRAGNYTEYALYMINQYGVDYVQELRELANSGDKITTPELRELLSFYRGEVAKLLAK